MSQIVEVNKKKDVTCPHCEKEFPVTIKQKPPSVEITEEATKEIKEKIVEVPKIEIKEVVKVPSHIPKIKCKDCKGTHENPNYSKRPHFKCTNCNSLNPGPECLTCNKSEEMEELTNEDLDDLGIPEPKENQHNHESEE